MDVPPAFKVVKPFIARADELDKSPADEPKVRVLPCSLISLLSILPCILSALTLFVVCAFVPSLPSQVVAYYCRQYAMERGLEIRTADPSVDPSFLVALMTKLETDKPGLPAGTTKQSAQVTTTDFANGVFDKADQEDRSGFADKVRE